MLRARRDVAGPPARPEQLMLDFGLSPGSQTIVRHALFFAILPDPPTALRLRRLAETLHVQHGLTKPPVAASRLHISLQSLGAGRRLDPAAVANGLRIGAQIARHQFDVVFDRAASFGRGERRPLVLCCSPGTQAALSGLREALGEASEALGLGSPRRRAFTAHLTLSWPERPIAETQLGAPVVWRARELVLVHSEQGAGRHNWLGRWPLGRIAES